MKSLAWIVVLLALFAAPARGAATRPQVQEFSMRFTDFYASVFNVPVELVEAVIEVESGWNPYAISKKGAAGLMQLMPETALRFGVQDRFNIEQNVRGGVAYLAWLIHLFQGDLRLAVAAYYVGESPILLRGLAYSSREVFEYVSRVAQLYRRMRFGSPRRLTSNRPVSEPRGGE